MEELKPCPFCFDGGRPELVCGIFGSFYARCAECGVYRASPLPGLEEDAINAWNTRAERTCHLELNFWDDHRGTEHDYLGCSECGEYISPTDIYGPDDGPSYCSNCGCEIDHSFITDYVSGDVIWKAGDGDLGDLSNPDNWRGAKVVE